jgi:hypothetical protein
MLRNLNAAPSAGLRILGTPKTGVPGSSIPPAGQFGSSLLYATLSMPADADKEVRGWITTKPSTGVLTAYENGAFVFDPLGQQGTFSFVYQLFVDGLAVGPLATVTLEIGTPPITLKNRNLNLASGQKRLLASREYVGPVPLSKSALMVWTGTAWAEASAVQCWTGSSWVAVNLWFGNGTAFIPL